MKIVPNATEPDWVREEIQPGEWNPGKHLLASIRAYQLHKFGSGALSPIYWRWAVLQHRFWSVVSGADIPLNCQIGGGLLLPHPNGIVIHPSAVIGPNCLIFQQVTLGTRVGAGAPRLGGRVDVGSGAKLLGNISVGDYARIGANAVVLSDMPPNSVAVGNPAVVKTSSNENAS